MKKIKFLSILLVLSLLTACSKDSSEANSTSDNSSGNGEVNTEGMVWFPKSAKGTCGDVLVAGIETEFDGEKLIYKYNIYSEDGRTSYYGFDLYYKDGSITDFYDSYKSLYSDDSELNKITMEYDEETDTVTVSEYSDDGTKIDYIDTYKYTFDAEGRVATKTVTFSEYCKNEDGEWYYDEYDPSVYTFEYVDNGYNIIYNYNSWDVYVDGESVEAIKRETIFVPYDKTQNHVKTIAYYDAATGDLIYPDTDEWYDIYHDNSAKSVFTFNNAGYLTDLQTHFSDGTTQAVDLNYDCEFTDSGQVSSYVEYNDDGSEYISGEITYDDNGNISNIVMVTEDGTYTMDIEWMLIPDYLFDFCSIYYENEIFSYAELIEDIIPERVYVDTIDYFYTKDMLLELYNK